MPPGTELTAIQSLIEDTESVFPEFREIVSRFQKESGQVPSLSACELPDAEQKRQKLEEAYERFKNGVMSGMGIAEEQFFSGRGSPDASLFVLGEGPADDDSLGKTFSGESGALLDKMLAAIQLDPKNVFVSYLQKYPQPQSKQEIPEMRLREFCRLAETEISIVAPRVILTMGDMPTRSIFQSHDGVMKWRGRTDRQYQDRIPLLATLAPALLIRQPGLKKYAWLDLQMLRDLLNSLEQAATDGI